ncbi:MAG: thiamine pyrophosphate-dependent dehydrogenase E1 component subunit alpha [Bacteroidetes bacterium]|nr:thiamine pyrophosphate-dependent dehydrogenase E1 component subunit alpha [Bacteroidota bacterium]
MMLRIRMCEESLVDPILKGEIKTPCHLYSGQEAVATGVGAALEQKDYVFGNHRSHGHYLAKGGDMTAMIAEIYGKEAGCSRGRGGSMHLISPENGVMGIVPIVSGTISLALGSALSIKIKKEDKVTVSFFGDGATGEGVLYESLNFASLKKLPIIFACENNLYSTHLPINEIRTNRNIFNIANPFEIETYRVDGNNVLEVYETAQKAVESCRSGKGPVFIEFLTYRFRGHVGPDDNIQGTHTDIRPKDEIEAWLKKDPLTQFKKYLIENNISTEIDFEQIQNKVEAEVNAANDFAKNSPKPNKEDLCKYVFK